MTPPQQTNTIFFCVFILQPEERYKLNLPFPFTYSLRGYTYSKRSTALLLIRQYQFIIDKLEDIIF